MNNMHKCDNSAGHGDRGLKFSSLPGRDDGKHERVGLEIAKIFVMQDKFLMAQNILMEFTFLLGVLLMIVLPSLRAQV